MPPARRAALVERLVAEYLRPGGRLIACSYGSGRTWPVGNLLRGSGFAVGAETSASNLERIVNPRPARVGAPS